ncbi:putative MPP superfamily phosphohydrolase [Bacillus tianshenii]|uniref:MPP superfamily phosphohydrolase n=1 Tax=Sutcliffiella tianshenii TaxID=1463404 RepID=A0ABS2NUC3_9BACI|nr:metallophosphoesterase [Bacillus tianshenii]MBM7618244.1 putative MPP superfamily phosphohydrolase [Bacillus tianshenii]
MKRVNRKKVILLLIVFLIVYIVFDNNRIKIVHEEIVVDSLAKEIDGFTVLQVTDLHEKEFGNNQKRLIDKINSLEYDAIVFTGDMLNSKKSSNYAPYYKLIEGIENKEHALFVPGNADPVPYLIKQGEIVKDEFIMGMEERGVQFLESNYAIHLGESVIRIVDFESSIISEKRIASYRDTNVDGDYSPYIRMQLGNFNKNMVLDEGDTDLLIALNHYPVVDRRIDLLNSDPNYNMREFDLLLAGHYHGGQFRIPFYGAIFIPEAYYDRNGLFPPQDRVKGLWEYKGIKQYVSTGLGSSDTLPFMKFRLFNTSELNVITFTSKK